MLHGIWLSGPTYKVGLMLSMCGEPFSYASVNLRAGEHKKPAYLAKNRFGQVPALEDGKAGLILCQSASILEYLAKEHGKFGGANATEALQAREWMFWDFDRLAAPIYRMRGQRLGIRSWSQTQAEGLVAEGNAALKVLDDHLKEHQWLVGAGPTIADIDVYGVVSYAPQGGYDLVLYPAVQAWMARFEALPGYGKPKDILPQESRA
jgi:glutathione S-transferase